MVFLMGITKPCKDGVEIVGPLLQPESLAIRQEEEPLLGAHGGMLSVQAGVCVRLGQSNPRSRLQRGWMCGWLHADHWDEIE